MTRRTVFIALGVSVGLTWAITQSIAAGAFDGTYRGAQRETVNNNSGQCNMAQQANPPVVVKDNVIRYSWGVPLEATVAADGTFSVDRSGLAERGASATVSLKGRISGGNLEADVGGSRCGKHLSFKKT